MNKELSIIVLKERAQFILDQVHEDEVTVSEYNDDFLQIAFNKINEFTLLALFHSGIDYGKKIFSI